MSVMYDIIVFGASGTTGTLVIIELIKYTAEQEEVKWAIAGRNETKLNASLRMARDYSGSEGSNIPIIIADITNAASLSNMCKQTKVLLNCAGPFNVLGEPILNACVEEGCHYLDVCCESSFLEMMRTKYHDPAKSKGVIMVGSCGFDNAPSDLGVSYVKDNFKGCLNSIDIYISLKQLSQNGGAVLSVPTWHSILHNLESPVGNGDSEEKEKLRARFKSSYPVQKRYLPHYSKEAGAWCVPYNGACASVLNHSQDYFHEQQNERPSIVNPYSASESFIGIMIETLYLLFLKLICTFQYGKYLCSKYYSLFSLGLVGSVPAGGKAITRHLFVGRGWRTKCDPVDQEYSSPPDQTIEIEIYTNKPGYESSAIYLVCCAIQLSRQKDKLPLTGGVYTPATAFHRTPYREYLEKNGIHFKQLSPCE